MNEQDVERRAQELADLFSDFEWIDFYKNVVIQLPEGKIQYILEAAKTKRSPRNYFKSAAKKEMDK